uniref:subtilisin n=1 Tax=Globisporangium ultimum (strain ATCC 200006 / CBS 805.95 / DAOM BR144) TaxID=431595 RepID=K3X3V6_GLOUD
MTCPTDPLGENKDCSKAPNVINNSWGGTPNSMFYQAAVDAWHAAGIIPIFGSGNVGKTCSTVLSPGDYANVITVGGTDQSDTLGDYSCKGPSLAGVMKPEVSAPGTDVRSAWSTSDNAYMVATGTSMATPHVTGIVAMLLQNNPNLTYNEIRKILTSTVDNSTLGSVNFTCGGIPDDTYPNNLYGYGRVNALSAVQSQEVTAPGPRM